MKSSADLEHDCIKKLRLDEELAITQAKPNPSVSNNDKDPCNSKSSTPPPFKDIGPIIKSPVDTKNYKVIELPNGLKAVLVSTCLHETNSGIPRSSATLQEQVNQFNKKYLGLDIPSSSGGQSKCTSENDKKKSEKKQPGPEPNEGKSAPEKDEEGEPKLIKCCRGMSTVCVTISSGAFHDPPEYNGMAHLLEHMIFLGSAKFPEENQIFMEVYKQGGIVNAVTQSDHTCFFFSANSGAFEGCLERLADAIKFPLLLDERIIKEREAIDSEYAIKQTCDMTRIFDFMRTLVKPRHPMGNFYWGNKSSLSRKGLCDRLRQWHKEYYVAKRMAICIHAPMPMKKLEEMALRHFSNVPANQIKENENLLRVHGLPFQQPEFCALYELETVGQWDWLVINWSLPAQFWQEYENKPLDYIKRMLDTRSPGGLVHLLEKKGLISDFISGCSTSDCFYRNEFTSMFGIQMRLTEEGVKRRDAILASVFSYINFLKERGKLKRCAEEMKRTYATNFHHKNWEELLNSSQELALSLSKEHIKPAHLLTSGGLLMSYSEENLKNCLDEFTPRAASFIFASNRMKGETEEKAWHCKIQFRKQTISEETYANLENVAILPEFAVPPENAFLCRDIPFEDANNGEEKKLQKDSKIYESDKLVVDFRSGKKDPCVSSLVPSASYYITFLSPVIHELPRKEGLLQIWAKQAFTRIFNEILFKFYRLYLFSVDVTDDGLSVLVSGPSRNLLELFTTVLNCIFRKESTGDEEQKAEEEDKFPVAHMEQLQGYHNDTLDTQMLSEGLLFQLLVDRFVNVFQQYDDLNNNNFEDYMRFIQNYKRKMFVEIELNGSVSQADCEGIIAAINGLNYSPCKLMSSSIDRGTVVPKGTTLLYLEAGHPAYVTSLITSHYQVCFSNEEANVNYAKILFHAMRRKLPHQLRTTEQLGYTVRLTLWDELGSVGFTIMVYTQPAKFTTEHVASRIDAFLQAFYDKYFKKEEVFHQLVAPYVKGKVDFLGCKRFYAGSLLENGSNFRKLCVQVRGFKPGAQMKVGKNYGNGKPLLRYRVPLGDEKLKELGEKGVQVIQNVGQFKRMMMLLPVNLN
ncbi:unnamed protein product [Orchesella dallaii]|uniref:Nardilysin n=1 Tax=Orchesella dallaii TaxID=48710 RepID=A0ABP1PNK0_9HEXA